MVPAEDLGLRAEPQYLPTFYSDIRASLSYHRRRRVESGGSSGERTGNREQKTVTYSSSAAEDNATSISGTGPDPGLSWEAYGVDATISVSAAAANQ